MQPGHGLGKREEKKSTAHRASGKASLCKHRQYFLGTKDTAHEMKSLKEVICHPIMVCEQCSFSHQSGFLHTRMYSGDKVAWTTDSTLKERSIYRLEYVHEGFYAFLGGSYLRNSCGVTNLIISIFAL